MAVPEPKIAMPESDRAAVGRIFNVTLCDLYVIYVKLRNFHWNVENHHFRDLHFLFEDQFNQIIQEIDDTAELVRQYGIVSFGSMKEFTSNCRLFEQPGALLDSQDMIRQITDDHEAMIRYMKVDADILLDKYHDIAGQNFMVDLITKHMKFAWFMRSCIEKHKDP